MITVTDIFAGAGGSSSGAEAVPGVHVAIARYVHEKFKHPGEPDACQSPHDTLCKAVW